MKGTTRIKSVTPLENFEVKLVFADGSAKVVDLKPCLEGPLFELMRNDPVKFREVRVDAEFGGLEWPNGADICPDLLYHGRISASQQKALR
jgi:hypothetical protein